MDIISHPWRWLLLKKQKITSIGEDVEKLKTLCLCCLGWKWFNLYEKQYWKFLKKLKMALPYDPAIPFLGVYLKELKARILNRCLCTKVPSSFIHSSQSVETTQAFTYGWKDKTECEIYLYNGLFALKRMTCYHMLHTT